MAKRYYTKFGKKKSYKKGSYKRKAMYGMKPTGKVYRKSILAQTNRRVIELHFPIYMRSSGTAATGLSPAAYVANPSFSNAGFGSSQDLIGYITGSQEFTNAARNWGLCKVNGVSLRYFSSTAAVTTNQSNGLISFNVSNRQQVGGSAADLANNWLYDQSLRVQVNGTTPGGSKSKYYKQPLREIQAGGNLSSLNAWTSISVIPNMTGNLFVNLGSPTQSASLPNHAVPNTNDILLIGKLMVKCYLSFAQPIVFP